MRNTKTFIFYFTYLVFAVIAYACKSETDTGREPVASVNNVFLYRDELLEVIPQGTSTNDSSRIAMQYINNWVKEQTLIQAAEDNLPAGEKDFNLQLRNYRNSLLIYSYEKALVSQKLDTIISDEEIKEYYNSNLEDFQLRDFLVKIIYLKINIEAPKQQKIEKWIESKDDSDLNKLEEYAFQYAENYFINTDDWLFLEDLLKELPMDKEESSKLLKRGNTLKFEQENYVYYLHVKDFRLKDSVAPLSVVKEKIKNILLNKRKVELIDRIRKQLYEDALSENKVKIYE